MNNSIVIAHRGFSGLYPENTILAFEKALELGADFIELDVREAKDGEIVVMHDSDVARTTDGEGEVAGLTLGEIKRLDAGKWKGAFKNVRVPSLDETLESVGGKAFLLIEIKKAAPDKVIGLVKKHGMEESVIIGGFNLDHLKKTREIAPRISTALITQNIPESPNILVESGIQMMDIHYRQLKSPRIRAFIDRGIACAAWTVDDPEEMKELIQSGFRFITTNRPDILMGLKL